MRRIPIKVYELLRVYLFKRGIRIMSELRDILKNNQAPIYMCGVQDSAMSPKFCEKCRQLYISDNCLYC